VPTTFDPATTSISFFLDTDQNPLTGSPGVNATGTIAQHEPGEGVRSLTGSPGVNATGTLDGSLIGSEFMVSFGSAHYDGSATVQATTSGFPVVGFSPVVFYNDGLLTIIPLTLLDNDDGLVNYKLASQQQVNANSFSGILDVALDVGSPVGRS
jgi:hypothetical protein